MSRNVAPRSNMQRKLGIIASSHDEFAKAAIRNAGTSILRNGMDDVRLTALDEYFGDCFANCSTLRDCVKMTLALGTCGGDKIGFAKCRRLTENRSGHSDCVIEGKCSNQIRRRIWVGCEMLRELDPGFQLNHRDKGFKYLVEQLDLLLRITTGPGDEQIGDARERSQPSFCAPIYRCVLNFINQGREYCRSHRLARHFAFEVGSIRE